MLTANQIADYGGYDIDWVNRKLKKIKGLEHFTLDEIIDVLDQPIVTDPYTLWNLVGKWVVDFAKRHNHLVDWEARKFNGREFRITPGQRIIDIRTKTDLIREAYEAEGDRYELE